MSGLMAAFILVNLSESYMVHKKRELTVMRINGFTVSECVRYAGTELIVTTVLGIVLGVGIGAFLGYRITLLLEQPFLQMVRSMDWRTPVLSVLITGFFALVINGRALRRIRSLNLTDA